MVAWCTKWIIRPLHAHTNMCTHTQTRTQTQTQIYFSKTWCAPPKTEARSLVSLMHIHIHILNFTGFYLSICWRYFDYNIFGSIIYLQDHEGYPSGSMVDFACDDDGSPILAVSSLAVHSKVKHKSQTLFSLDFPGMVLSSWRTELLLVIYYNVNDLSSLHILFFELIVANQELWLEQNLVGNPKCSLLVAKDPDDRTDTVVTVYGDAISVCICFIFPWHF